LKEVLEHIYGQLQKQGGELSGLTHQCTDRFVFID